MSLFSSQKTLTLAALEDNNIVVDKIVKKEYIRPFNILTKKQ